VSEFLQDPPRLSDPYTGDELLRSWIARHAPAAQRREIEGRLERFGARVLPEFEPLAQAAEAAPARHVPFDAWGRRVDRIETSEAWRRLHGIAAEEGLVATAYERHYSAFSRPLQFALVHLFQPSSAIVTCPLAMTDGAARVLELFGTPEQRARYSSKLLSRVPELFWTAGQWMTERTGGSDVSTSETVARRPGAQREPFALSGTKWFTSAATAELALTLARIEGAPAGSRGLSMFLLETGSPDTVAKGIEVLRLKDKLGTRALPTAELVLSDTPAELIGAEGKGVKTITTVLNMTRLWNAACAAATMRRAVALARDYASRRSAFGRRLEELPLHRGTLAELETECALAFLLTMRVAALLGRDECGEATAEERALLRLLVPLVKLFTGKQAVAVVSEALECVGGAAYVEDTGFPRLLRDAQVFPIWEGTTNVLSLDVLRVLERQPEALAIWARHAESALATGARTLDPRLAENLRREIGELRSWAPDREEEREAGARRFALGLARSYATALLAEHAAWEAKDGGFSAAIAVLEAGTEVPLSSRA